MKEYMSVKETAKKWRISDRRVQVLCATGRIPGAFKCSSVWLIPKNSSKPEKLPSGPKKMNSKKD